MNNLTFRIGRNLLTQGQILALTTNHTLHMEHRYQHICNQTIAIIEQLIESQSIVSSKIKRIVAVQAEWIVAIILLTFCAGVLLIRFAKGSRTQFEKWKRYTDQMHHALQGLIMDIQTLQRELESQKIIVRALVAQTLTHNVTNFTAVSDVESEMLTLNEQRIRDPNSREVVYKISGPNNTDRGYVNLAQCEPRDAERGYVTLAPCENNDLT